MKPLSKNEIPSFLERFGNFKDAEFRSLEVLSASQIKLTFALQDKARAFDWITLELEFSSIEDARLLDNNKLSFVDMGDGCSLIHDDEKFAFGIGECYNISIIKNSTCYLVSNNLKYQEGLF
ncbi:hypothetical protein GJV85_13195 [Sulfurimonas aquatica]|uniref:Uncharacterized protein n=1 Tax=Sulfurimonas aquatica TaxID=2672570 RepID=A0A975B2Q2_9BACT|nr:hypothetical protein [Sulfurimonas aquatica]QSZ43020.1 hypothetical protein GJV85_13195 [Sulfurimonas aquatica]